jgi:hypothetical protein
LGGVDGSPMIVLDSKFGAGEDVSILGGRSSLSSTSPALLGESFFRLTEGAVEGGRDTYFCGVVLVFFRENHPDFF